MKKNLFIILALISFSLSSITPGWALLRDDIAVAQGKVISKDIARNEITIADMYSGEKKIFVVSEDHANSLNPDDEVFITFQIGSNEAKFLRLVHPHE